MFKREVIDEQEMLSEMQHINAGLKSLQQELAVYEKQLTELLEKELSATRMAELTQTIRMFVESGGDQLTFEDKRHIVETLVDEILIRFDGDEVKVTAVGALDELKRQQFLSPGNDIGSCSQPQVVDSDGTDRRYVAELTAFGIATKGAANAKHAVLPQIKPSGSAHGNEMPGMSPITPLCSVGPIPFEGILGFFVKY